MKHSYFKIKEKIKPLSQVVLKLSSEACFGIFSLIAIILTGLMYSACMNVNSIPIATVSAVRSQHALLEKHVRSVVSGYPIEVMAPYIARHNKTSAAFLVGIAKKESDWGKHVPVDEAGNDCFNYFGFKGAGSRGIEMGHGCFGSPEEAIRIVGARVDTMVNEYEFTTPEDFIVWKCGWSCKGHSNESVQKWISDVKIYFNKVYN